MLGMCFSVHSGMMVMERVLKPAVPLLVLYFILNVLDPEVRPVRNTVLARLTAWLAYCTEANAPLASEAEWVVVPFLSITSNPMKLEAPGVVVFHVIADTMTMASVPVEVDTVGPTVVRLVKDVLVVVSEVDSHDPVMPATLPFPDSV